MTTLTARFRRRLLAAAALAGMAVTGGATDARAAVVTVNTTAADDASDALCGLIEAVRAINQHATYRNCAYVLNGQPDSLQVSSGTHVVNVEMTLTRSVDIIGAGRGSTVIHAGGIYAFGLALDGSDGPRLTVTLRSLTLQKSASQTLPVMGIYASSGAVPQGLVLDDVRVTGFTGPGVYLSGEDGGVSATIQNSTIENNAQGIKIHDASASLLNSIIRNNSGNGVAIKLRDVSSVVQISECAIQGNTTAGSGAGISYEHTGSSGEGVTFLTIAGSTISGNRAQLDGGGLYATGDFTVQRTIFDGNTAARNGGGIGAFGAGETVDATIRESIVKNNRAVTGHGAGIDIDGNGSGNGAYLYLYSSQVGPNNVAGADGGGIWSSGQIGQLANTTISGNTAVRGGGLFHAGDGEQHMYTTTVAFNRATGVGGGGGMWTNPSNPILRFCIFSDNTAPAPPPNTPTYADVFTSHTNLASYSVVKDGTGMQNIFVAASGNKVGVDPRLSPDLMKWGGFAALHALQWGSPAIDIGPAAPPHSHNEWHLVDQRGVARPNDGADGASPARNGMDAGAFEQVSGANDDTTGFESLSRWSSIASLSLNTTRKTQGKSGINIGGSGPRTLTSAALTTPLLPLSGHLALDFFIPSDTMVSSSAVGMSVSCPATGFNSSFGTVSLSGLATNAFRRLTFNVGAAARAVLAQTRSDCTFKIAVNTNSTVTSPVVDNVRFVP